MPKPNITNLFVAVIAMATLGVRVSNVFASGGAGFDRLAGAHIEAHAGVSLDQAIQMVEQQYGAKVVRATVGEDNGRRVYVLRLVSEQGRVWTVRVDAASGQMM
ncbi:MAG: PepSY domain-containing protein [Steroidobacteraceae bacterium]